MNKIISRYNILKNNKIVGEYNLTINFEDEQRVIFEDFNENMKHFREIVLNLQNIYNISDLMEIEQDVTDFMEMLFYPKEMLNRNLQDDENIVNSFEMLKLFMISKLGNNELIFENCEII